MNQEYYKKENEDELEYFMRLVSKKKEDKVEDLDWSDIVDLLGLDLNKDSLRKSQDTEFGGFSVYKKMKDKGLISKDYDYKTEVQGQLQELKKERMKISDERSSLNRLLREKAREEDILNLINKYGEQLKEKNPYKFKEIKISKEKNKSAILTLSDVHYGLQILEFNNKYNPEICIERFNKLASKSIEILTSNDIKDLYILGLGDYISGLIHNTTRVENRETVISQVMQISEILSGFMIKISEVCNIYYCDVTDNHGRLFQNKEENLNKDNFSILIKFFLKGRFENNPRIKIMDNEINESIGLVNILGKNYGFVHGHQDKVSNVVQNLSLMTKKFYESIFIAHSHHFEANEIHGTYVYMNGTFAGIDEYANNGRLTSNPSQNLFVVTKEGIESQYLIKL